MGIDKRQRLFGILRKQSAIYGVTEEVVKVLAVHNDLVNKIQLIRDIQNDLHNQIEKDLKPFPEYLNEMKEVRHFALRTVGDLERNYLFDEIESSSDIGLPRIISGVWNINSSKLPGNLSNLFVKVDNHALSIMKGFGNLSDDTAKLCSVIEKEHESMIQIRNKIEFEVDQIKNYLENTVIKQIQTTIAQKQNSSASNSGVISKSVEEISKVNTLIDFTKHIVQGKSDLLAYLAVIATTNPNVKHIIDLLKFW